MIAKQQPTDRKPAVAHPDSPEAGQRVLMLSLATVGFAVNFWAWALLSPLGPLFRIPFG